MREQASSYQPRKSEEYIAFIEINVRNFVKIIRILHAPPLDVTSQCSVKSLCQTTQKV